MVSAAPDSYATVLREALVAGRRLDRQNATSAVLEQDFGRFDLALWRALDEALPGARRMLDEVNSWRNAIAHQDAVRLSGLELDLPTVRRWRRLLDELATAMDGVVGGRIRETTGRFPWEPR